MHEIIVTELPPVTDEVKGCWFNGYPVHQGYNEDSLNYATVYANEQGIIPDQEVLQSDWNRLVETLRDAGFPVHIVPFPEKLNRPDCLYHDAVFNRDSGMMFNGYWIQGNFSARGREVEADVYAEIIPEMFDKELITLPEEAFLEFGEVFFLETEEGTYYFGGLSRSNRKGHEFVRDIVQPDHYFLLRSIGYHLDTVFTPVWGPENTLDAIIIAPDLIYQESLDLLESLGMEIIEIETIDSSGEGKELGDYAVNALVAPGILVNCCEFQTPGVEERLHDLGIQRYITPLTYFKYAGGSVHCLTNEVYPEV
ncbi:MAG: hypothetical protein K9N46_00885 [Candidatus Marinimicrobia bacterium]|nr:hypothetical protein [Candidatus Neomarinimicrobiota bacterium]MCF7827968.1 hypothetical protein [Candidatus Neomarinimicrobiota bacterium]MCF7879277.1 hypothetical protein [Candidatus Neomarinimicrobiota bacterium]